MAATETSQNQPLQQSAKLNFMHREQVRELEDACETALESAVKELQPGVSEHTLHMMAKAAVAVLEATVKPPSKA